MIYGDVINNIWKEWKPLSLGSWVKGEGSADYRGRTFFNERERNIS